jgi:hypothetical protein
MVLHQRVDVRIKVRTEGDLLVVEIRNAGGQPTKLGDGYFVWGAHPNDRDKLGRIPWLKWGDKPGDLRRIALAGAPLLPGWLAFWRSRRFAAHQDEVRYTRAEIAQAKVESLLRGRVGDQEPTMFVVVDHAGNIASTELSRDARTFVIEAFGGKPSTFSPISWGRVIVVLGFIVILSWLLVSAPPPLSGGH